MKNVARFSLAILLCFGASVHAQSLERGVPGINGGLLLPNGQFFLALDVAEKALDAAEKDFGPDHPSVATSLNRLAALYVHQGKFTQAVALYNRSLAIYEKALAANSSAAAALSALSEKPGREPQVVVLAKK